MRDTRHHFTNRNFLTVLDGSQGADLESDIDRMIRASNFDFLASLVQKLHLRTHAFICSSPATLWIDNHQSRKSRDVVDLLGDSCTLFDIFKADGSRVLADDRTCMRIPSGKNLTNLDHLPIIWQQSRTIRHLVALTFTTVVIRNQNLAST